MSQIVLQELKAGQIFERRNTQVKSQLSLSKQNSQKELNDLILRSPQLSKELYQRSASKEKDPFQRRLSIIKKESVVTQFDECFEKQKKKDPQQRKINRLIFQFKRHSNEITKSIQQLSDRLDSQARKKTQCDKHHVNRICKAGHAHDHHHDYLQHQAEVKQMRLSALTQTKPIQQPAVPA